MKKLKRCPFCNGEAEVIQTCGAYVVRCQLCGSHTFSSNDENVAAMYWNRRQYDMEREAIQASLDFMKERLQKV